jgi:DNA-binding transcriptional regulator GbsR (MarR family)
MKLSESEKKFILHWGEMGGKWGINRTVAQIHALLFISPIPLNAEDISNTLTIARSNVSTSIKELLNWEIIKAIPLLGDRREHYEAIQDVWQMFRIISEKRKKKEIDPTVNIIKECLLEKGETDNELNEYSRTRLKALTEFFDTILDFYESANKLPTESIIQLLKVSKQMDKFLKLI